MYKELEVAAVVVGHFVALSGHLDLQLDVSRRVAAVGGIVESEALHVVRGDGWQLVGTEGLQCLTVGGHCDAIASEFLCTIVCDAHGDADFLAGLDTLLAAEECDGSVIVHLLVDLDVV